MLCKCTSTTLLSKNVAPTNFQVALRAGALWITTGCLVGRSIRAIASIYG